MCGRISIGIRRRSRRRAIGEGGNLSLKVALFAFMRGSAGTPTYASVSNLNCSLVSLLCSVQRSLTFLSMGSSSASAEVVDIPACRSSKISLRCRLTRFRMRTISPLMNSILGMSQPSNNAAGDFGRLNTDASGIDSSLSGLLKTQSGETTSKVGGPDATPRASGAFCAGTIPVHGSFRGGSHPNESSDPGTASPWLARPRAGLCLWSSREPKGGFVPKD
jgi:hypothetical protein